MYHGVITLDDNQIPVIIELSGHRVRMSSSGTEIGEWPIEECRISHLEDSTYTITAEDETLRFVPSQPSLFAAAVNEGKAPAVALPPPPEDQPADRGLRTAPAPKPLTVGLFYALCVVTAALALWALISMVF